MERDNNAIEERALLAMRLISAVDFLISVARSSGLSRIAAQLEDVQRDLKPLLRDPKPRHKTAGRNKRAVNDDP